MGPLARDDVARLIAGGEDSFVEFKDPRVSNDSLAKEVCGFANAQGGRVLIGAGDDGGISDASGWAEETIMNIARTSVEPPIIPTFQRLGWSDDEILVIVGVEVGSEKPYARVSGETRKYYLRVGSTTREASREELIRLTQASGAVASDLRPVPQATHEDLDSDMLTERFEGRRSLEFESLDRAARERVLVAAEILEPETKRPTIGGLLCFGQRPQDHLPFANVVCTAYPQAVVSRELVDREDASGRVDEQIESAAAFITRNLGRASEVKGLRRIDRLDPSEESLREAVANAVAHRHYGIAGPSHVRVFDNRVEVLSPGAPPNGVSSESMRVGVSVRRNEFVFARLAELGLVDAVGRGLVLLFEEAVEIGLREPTISIEENWTQLTMWRGVPPS